MPKYYAVKAGRVPGVYLTWPDCQKQVIGFSGAVYKSFATKEEAEAFARPVTNDVKIDNVVYTDGSFADNKAGGAAVFCKNGKVYMQAEEVKTNNRGELLGIILALQHSEGPLHICTDSEYSINVCANGYTASENRDLVEKIRNLMKSRLVRFEKVPAHSGLKYNDLADLYADQARLLDPKSGVKIEMLDSTVA